MKFEVNISKRYFFAILSSILILAGTLVVYAYGTGPGNVLGHTGNELDVTIAGQPYNLQQAIDQGKLGGGLPAPDYDSGWLSSWAWVGGGPNRLTYVSHGLGQTPVFYIVQLKYKTTTAGHEAGDVVTITSDNAQRTDNVWLAYSIYANPNTLGVNRFGYGQVNDRIDVYNEITPTIFEIRYMAWKQFGPQSGGVATGNDFSVAGQAVVATATKASVTTVTIGTPTTKAAIVSFNDVNGGNSCRDAVLNLYKPGSPDVYVGTIWQRTNNADVYVLDKGAFAIVPLTNGQFRMQLTSAGDATTCDINIVKIGYLN